MTVTQLLMHNLAPRGITATCVPTTICFCTGASYYDVEEVLVREQPKNYRPDLRGNKGVHTDQLLRESRVLFGHKFTRASFSPRGFTVDGFIRTHPRGLFLLRIHKHVFAVKDGVVYDLCNTNMREQVFAAWQVEKLS